MKKKIFTLLLMLLIVVTTTVSAAEIVNSTKLKVGPAVSPEMWLDKYIKGLFIDGEYQQIEFIRRASDDKAAYCVEPFDLVSQELTYDGYEANITEVMPSMSRDQWNKIQALAYYGYGYKEGEYDHTSQKWYGVTQVMIWRIACPEITVKFAKDESAAASAQMDDSLFRAEQDELQALVDSMYHIEPSFYVPENLMINHEYPLVDVNGVLENYVVANTTNCSAYIQNNTLYVTPSQTGEINVELQKGNYANKATLYVATLGDDSVQNVMVPGEYVYTTTVKAEAVSARIKVIKEDVVDSSDILSLQGAEYTIYNIDDQPIDVITIGEGNTGKSGDLPYGVYKVKETKAPAGYEMDETEYTVEITESNIDINNPIYEIVSKEDIIRGQVKVTKSDIALDGTVIAPSAGAQLRLVRLDAQGNKTNKVYDAFIDRMGEARFYDPKYEQYGASTIPYGNYIVEEIKASDNGEHLNMFFKDDTVLSITETDQVVTREFTDVQIAVKFSVIKIDEVTGKVVTAGGATFKLWDITNQRFVTAGGTDEFVTDSTGTVTIPENIAAGYYRLYETKAPAGYEINEKVQLVSEDLDNHGIEVTLTDITLGMTNEMKLDSNVVMEADVQVQDRPLSGFIHVVKTGEMLTNAEIYEGRIIDQKYDVYKPVYEERGLEGVVFQIIAKAGNPYYAEGTIIDTITTDANGEATSKEMYLGTYAIKEVSTPYGYIINPNLPDVCLEEADKVGEIYVDTTNYKNEKQKTHLTFDKVFEATPFATENKNDVREAIFVLIADQDIFNCYGEVVIKKGDMMDIFGCETTQNRVRVDCDIDIPEGDYYFREVYASAPYTLNGTKQRVHVAYDNKAPLTEIKGTSIVNKEPSANIVLVKSSTTLFKEKVQTTNEIMVNSEVTDQLAMELYGKTIEQARQNVAEYYGSNNTQQLFVDGAVYGVYLNDTCTEPLRTVDGKEATLVTENGFAVLKDVPFGNYFIKEIKAPAGYRLDTNIYLTKITEKNNGKNVYEVVMDDAITTQITKTDFFTSEVVPNCVFEITDEQGNVLLHTKTDDKGYAYIPLDIFVNGNKYFYEEIEADDTLYELNPEKHEFVASWEEKVDENGLNTIVWTGTPLNVENYRKTSDVTFMKSDFAETTLIPNCKFELKSEETGYYESGVTDENGEYVFKNVPYGKYTYTELEAPEGYYLDTEPHEFRIDAKQMTVKMFDYKIPTNTSTHTDAPNAPVKGEEVVTQKTTTSNVDTGDIAVYAIAGIGIVCLAGIAFVVVRKVKNSKK